MLVIGIGWTCGLVVMVGWLGGCATPLPVTSERMETATAPADEAKYWWYLRFRLTWPEEEEPIWYPDLLLADQVIGPVLDAEHEAILLWRFHRRAARDGAGRQFSFIFRATPATAARINARIAADPLVIRLREKGVIQTVGYDDPDHPQRPGIGDTSDKNWSPEMQVAWPYFIMGVSQLWLELIREIGKNQRWSKEPLARYAVIERTLDAMWRDEGGHALLHHLSAVFGYRELTVTRQELMKF